MRAMIDRLWQIQLHKFDTKADDDYNNDTVPSTKEKEQMEDHILQGSQTMIKAVISPKITTVWYSLLR